MYGSKGFTLLELLVAIAIAGVGFSVIFDLLSKSRLDFSYSERLFMDLLELNNGLVEGRAGLELSRERLKDYPEIEEITYGFGSARIFMYQPAK
ncbi:MAG: prepilin-type N-terminal cleavage/methylation domain-containing protein [Acidobacteria bacterium]|jgi:prepilin-type N-terminal cleavage/methylation domain-containing protein|nr:MAG: prepilin-type N-terminal cleavage/methylation domain-containing protein [Acidobacteriota bacterium]